MSVGQAVFLVIALVMNTRPIVALINYPLHEQLRDCLPALGLSLLTLGPLWLLAPLLALSAPVKLVALLGLGGGIYGLAAITFRVGPFRSALAMMMPPKRGAPNLDE